MSNDQRWALLIVGLVAIAVYLASPISPLPGLKTRGKSPGDIVWRAGYPVGHQGHVAPDVADPLWSHPLYRRPWRPGHNRQCVIDYGWEWIANSPTEEGLGDGSAS